MSSPAVHPCTDTCHGSVCVFVCACVAAAVVVVVAEMSWVPTDIDAKLEQEVAKERAEKQRREREAARAREAASKMDARERDKQERDKRERDRQRQKEQEAEEEQEAIESNNPIASFENEVEEQDDAMFDTEPQSKKQKKAADKAAKCVPLLGSFQSPAEVDRSIDRSREIAALIDSRSVPLKLEFLLETWLHTNLACHREEAKKKKKKGKNKKKKKKKKTQEV